MAQRWDAVAQAINDRLSELDMRPTTLERLAKVSKRTLYELRYNTTQRDRGDNTLAAISSALGLHRDHLDAILNGRDPLPRDKDAPEVLTESESTGRIAMIESNLRLINKRLDSMDDRLDNVAPSVLDGMRKLFDDLNR